MTKFLTTRILEGKLSFDKVPLIFKEQVKKELFELGRPDLAN